MIFVKHKLFACALNYSGGVYDLHNVSLLQIVSTTFTKLKTFVIVIVPLQFVSRGKKVWWHKKYLLNSNLVLYQEDNAGMVSASCHDENKEQALVLIVGFLS